VHGISGNFYLDRESGEAVVMTGPELLRAPTVMAEFSQHGATVVSVTAKDKLRQQLGKGMDLSRGSVNASSELASTSTVQRQGIDRLLEFVGRPQPDMYSPELSLFVLEAGVKLLQTRQPLISYLSLTDYIQHKYAPGEPEADRYYRNLDALFGRLDAMGVTLAITADHGMNDKSRADGSPNVIWLQDLLDAKFGKGTSTVICPITDRFVVHHGALGGFVRVYCHGSLDPEDVIKVVRGVPGIEAAYDKWTAARFFELPLDREGDVVVVGKVDTCIGASEADHDLSGLRGHRLRTHGALHESRVPFVLNRPLRAEYAARAALGGLHSYHLFDFAINGVQ
jgi:phosphonoacetate hydrolase